MQRVASGLIYDATTKPVAERIAFFSGLCPLRSGTILAGFQAGASKHAANATARLCRSRDRGQTWQELPWRFETRQDGIPGSLSAAEIVETEPGRLLVFTTWFDRSDPTRPLFDPATEGLLRSRSLMAESRDEGDTWTPWRVLPTPGLTGCAMTGPALRWDERTIAFAFESFKEFDDLQPVQPGAWLLVSRDGGQTFETPYLVARDPANATYYWDQRLCPVGSDGDFVAMFWTHDRAAKRDRTVHLLRGSLRSPGGLPGETSLPGQIAAPLLLDDGRLFAFVIDRGRPGTLTLWLSRDGGETWPREQSLVVHVHDEQARLSQGKENIDFAQYWEDMGKWSFGHPAIRRLDKDHLLLAFYAGTPEAMSIHWARISLID